MTIAGRINLKHLRAFQAVAHHRHFTRAAEAIAISQPALSALVAQLECDLAVTLLNRTSRSVELTPAGREFFAACNRILADVDAAIGEARDYARLRRGRLRLAVLPSLTRTLLPDVLRVFQARHPGVTLSVLDLPGDPLVENVLSGQVDLGIGYAEPGALLNVIPLLTDRLIAVFRRGALPVGAGGLRWADLAAHDVIAMNHGTTVRRVMDDGARRAGVALRIVLESQQMPTAIAYARAGLGVAILPSIAIAPGEEADLATAPLVEPAMERGLSILSRNHLPMPPAAQTFSALLLDHVGTLGG